MMFCDVCKVLSRSMGWHSWPCISSLRNGEIAQFSQERNGFMQKRVEKTIERYERVKGTFLDNVSVMMVLGTMVILLAGYFVFLAYQRRIMQVDVEVLDQTKFSDEQVATANQQIQPVVTKHRHLYIEADRLRIAQALAAASTGIYIQAIVEDVRQHRNLTYDGNILVNKLQANSLLPPGVTNVGNGRCVSEFGVYDVRADTNHNIIEVLAVGKTDAENGDTYLVQLNPSDVSHTVRIWRSSAKNVTLAVGLSAGQLLQMGWLSEPLRDPQITEEVKAQVQGWIQNGGK